MIATAAADGAVDPAERARITDELRKSGMEAESAGFLDAALANPATPDQIATRVGSEQKLAAQVYAAASLVAEPGNAPARAYLGRLATALGLSADLVAHLEGNDDGRPSHLSRDAARGATIASHLPRLPATSPARSAANSTVPLFSLIRRVASAISTEGATPAAGGGRGLNP